MSTALPTAPAETRSVLLVDDHPLFRYGLTALIHASDEFRVCGEVGRAEEAIPAIQTFKPDAVIVDVSLPDLNGIALVGKIHQVHPALPILMMSSHEELRYALGAIRAGAMGYVIKTESATQVITALETILNGDKFFSTKFTQNLSFQILDAAHNGRPSPLDELSAREREVFKLIGEGHTTRTLADKLNLSAKTVETHRTHILHKLALRDSGELVRLAEELVVGDAKI